MKLIKKSKHTKSAPPLFLPEQILLRYQLSKWGNYKNGNGQKKVENDTKRNNIFNKYAKYGIVLALR
jgi:hypothetical protein